MVDVAEDADDGGTGDAEFVGFNFFFECFLFSFLFFFFFGKLGLRGRFFTVLNFEGKPVFLSDTDGDLFVNDLVHGCEDAHFHEFGDQSEGFKSKHDSKVAYDNREFAF